MAAARSQAAATVSDQHDKVPKKGRGDQATASAPVEPMQSWGRKYPTV
jgi:hypothetical protein